MARNGSGVYSLPAVYEATTGDTILATQHNTPLEDLEQDANTARPVVAGGTGSTTKSGAATALEVVSYGAAQTLTDTQKGQALTNITAVGYGPTQTLTSGEKTQVRTNLGLGDSALKDVGTTTGTVAAGDDSRITGALQSSDNLSDVADAATARTNIGLGTAATKDTGTSDGDVVEVQTGGKLPALDGSDLTNLQGFPLSTSHSLPVGWIGLMYFSGGGLADGDSTAGSFVQTVVSQVTGPVKNSATTQAGTWVNRSGQSLGTSGSGFLFGVMQRTA